MASSSPSPTAPVVTSSLLSLTNPYETKTNADLCPFPNDRYQSITGNDRNLSSCFPPSSDTACNGVGFYYFDNYLSKEEGDKIMSIIDNNPWCTLLKRRQQFYGETYYHTTHNLPSIQPTFNKLTPSSSINDNNNNRISSSHSNGLSDISSSSSSLPPSFSSLSSSSGPPSEFPTTPFGYYPLASFQFLIDRIVSEPWFKAAGLRLPTQVLVNEYNNTDGIGSHYDDHNAFGEYIITISLLAKSIWTLSQPLHATNACPTIVNSIDVALDPLSLSIALGDSRYLYRHAISRKQQMEIPAHQGGGLLVRGEGYRRVSLTIRTLLPGRKQVKDDIDTRHLRIPKPWCPCLDALKAIEKKKKKKKKKISESEHAAIMEMHRKRKEEKDRMRKEGKKEEEEKHEKIEGKMEVRNVEEKQELNNTLFDK